MENSRFWTDIQDKHCYRCVSMWQGSHYLRKLDEAGFAPILPPALVVSVDWETRDVLAKKKWKRNEMNGVLAHF